MMTDAVLFGATWIALNTGHWVMDYWGQKSEWAANKGRHGNRYENRVGAIACAKHVGVYTAGTAVLVMVTALLLNLPLSPAGLVLGQAVSAGTHYWADRRFTLRGLAERTGNGGFWTVGAPRSGAQVVLAQPNGTFRREEDGSPMVVDLDNAVLGTGAHQLDQSWHRFWLFIAALITALV